MFSIDQVKDTNELIDSVEYREFKIKIGDFEESLLLPLCCWSIEKYKHHWSKQLKQFYFDKKEKTCLITEMYDPSTANFVRWWILYRVNDDVFFQEQVLFLEDIKGPFSVDDAELYIPEREIINEDGEEISEWVVPFEQLKNSPLLK